LAPSITFFTYYQNTKALMRSPKTLLRKAAAMAACGFLLTTTVSAQEFAGVRTSNYAGVSSVFVNPANIADSRHRWSFSLFNVGTFVGNDKASFSLKDIGRTLDFDSLKNKIFSEGAGGSNGFATVAVQGPSLYFNLNRKSALAFTTRARAMTNIVEIDGKLAKQLIDGDDNSGLPYTIASANNMIVNANGWTEFGVSYARELFSKGAHYLKGGLTLKYLAGAANASIQINQLNTTLDLDLLRNDAYLTNSSGRIGLNFGGINFEDVEATDLLAFNSTGFGADIGVVYEYRPAGSPDEKRRDLNKYKFRFGAALLDAGSINYERDVARSGGYSIRINPSRRFYLNALSEASVDNFKDTLNRYPQFFTPDAANNATRYRVAMPSTLQLNADYHLNKGFYINLASQLSLIKNTTKTESSQYFNAVTLTPRLESKGFGLYVPLMYNSLTEFTAGASFRFGSFFFGSGSVLSAAFGNSKAADFFFGFHIGSRQKEK
jgi:hypothetical protein